MPLTDQVHGGLELVNAETAWFAPDFSPLDRAILKAIAYADIFEFPLTAAEIHRYLVGIPLPLEGVRLALESGGLAARLLSRIGGYYTLPGREAIVATRRRRAEISAELWQQAIRYGRIIANLPFVRMVAVTGALAVDNVERDADIDYLIVTEPGRLWLSRAWVVALVRAVSLRGIGLCPNYLLSERALVFRERNLYTAHELAQMVPISGLECYHQMRRKNAWAEAFLPNSTGPARLVPQASGLPRPVLALAEGVLRSSAGGLLEGWEMNRKIQKFSRLNGDQGESDFSRDWCKGHFDRHGQKTMVAFHRRLQSLEALI